MCLFALKREGGDLKQTISSPRPYHTVRYRTVQYHRWASSRRNHLVITRIIHYWVPYRTVPYRTVSYHTVPYRIVLYRTVPYRIILWYRTVSCHTVPYRIVPNPQIDVINQSVHHVTMPIHRIVRYRTVPDCTVPYHYLSNSILNRIIWWYRTVWWRTVPYFPFLTMWEG
jgi:hypothetical protein